MGFFFVLFCFCLVWFVVCFFVLFWFFLCVFFLFLFFFGGGSGGGGGGGGQLNDSAKGRACILDKCVIGKVCVRDTSAQRDSRTDCYIDTEVARLCWQQSDLKAKRM